MTNSEPTLPGLAPPPRLASRLFFAPPCAPPPPPSRTAQPNPKRQLLLWSLHPLARFRLRHVPGPRPSLFVGNALELRRLGQVEAYSRWAREHGPVFKVWLGSRPVVVVADAAAGKRVNLRNPTRHPLLQPMTYSKFGRVAGKGLFVVGATDPVAHRELKAIWLRVFNSASLSGFVDEMALGADVLCAKVRRAADDGAAIDVWRALGAMTMDVVAKCAFGLDLNTQFNEGAEADERAEAKAKVKAAAAAHAAGKGSSSSASTSPASSQPSSPMASAATAAKAAAVARACPSPSSSDDESSSPSDSDSEERDLLARSMLSSARTIFATGATSSIYGLLAMALPEISRPVLKLFGTLFPGRVLRELEAARATMFETSLALTRAARARIEGGGGASASAPPSRDAPRGVAKGAFPELFITASRGSGDGASQQFDDVTIASQCQTFLLAGYETTATTLAFCVHWLAAHPEAAAKLARELDEAARAEGEGEGEEGRGAAAGDDGDGAEAATAATCVAGIGASRVARLPYLDAVLKEVLRLTPAAPITLRVAAQDQAVSFPSSTATAAKGVGDGEGTEAPKASTTRSLVIPRGTWIHVDSFNISRDPSVWGPDALQFRPERWLEKSPASAALQTWAFGDGSLACVGRRLAEWESKLTLAALFRRFEFSLEPERKGQALELECKLTLGPKAGVTVMATARKEAAGEEEKAAAPPSLAKKTSSGLFGSREAVPAAA